MREAIILAIEAAVAGGSLSLLQSGTEVANYVGKGPLASAESLLVSIDRLFGETNLRRNDVDLVAVSAGPGSYTGIRVGLATALGLKTGLGIPTASVSALLAVAAAHPGEGPRLVALPAGRGSVCAQSVVTKQGGATAMGRPHLMTADEFVDLCQKADSESVLVHGSLFEALPADSRAVDVGWNLAGAIGRYCAAAPDVQTPPLFIRNES
jgi:tRNA threonylcarbamoyladenosine biosynthesis protein TsaB